MRGAPLVESGPCKLLFSHSESNQAAAWLVTMAKHTVPWVSPVSCPECLFNEAISIRIELEESGGDGGSNSHSCRWRSEWQVCEAEGGGGGWLVVVFHSFCWPLRRRRWSKSQRAQQHWVSALIQSSFVLLFGLRRPWTCNKMETQKPQKQGKKMFLRLLYHQFECFTLNVSPRHWNKYKDVGNKILQRYERMKIQQRGSCFYTYMFLKKINVCINLENFKACPGSNKQGQRFILNTKLCTIKCNNCRRTYIL